MIAFGSAPDPYVIRSYAPQGVPNGVPYYGPSSRTLLSTTAWTSVTDIIIVDGQSNMASGGSTAFSPVNPASIGFMDINDGGIYSYAEPMIGCTYAPNAGPSSIMGRYADDIITRGKSSKVLIVPIAMGGTPWVDAVPGATADLFSNMRTAILRLRAKGLEPTKILCGRGETDAGLGSSAAFITSSINSYVDGIRALSCTAPVYMGYYTMLSGATNSTIRTGVTNSITGNTGRKILTGYDCDTGCPAAGGYRQGDGTHQTNLGLNTSGPGWSGVTHP